MSLSAAERHAGEIVAKATSDGYTLFLASNGQISIAPALYQKMPYDPAKAKQLLAEAGFGPANPLRTEVLVRGIATIPIPILLAIALITVIIAQLSWRGWVTGLRALLRGVGVGGTGALRVAADFVDRFARLGFEGASRTVTSSSRSSRARSRCAGVAFSRNRLRGVMRRSMYKCLTTIMSPSWSDRCMPGRLG